MPRFFVKEENVFDDYLIIEGEDAHHIARVLRMKEGEELTLCDFFNTEYRHIVNYLLCAVFFYSCKTNIADSYLLTRTLYCDLERTVSIRKHKIRQI